jgi:putative lipoic acid-binding regulatory protein
MKRKIKNSIKSFLSFIGLLNILRKIKYKLSPPPLFNIPIHHDIYGNIYLPYYNTHTFLNNNYPDIYNQQGKKMELFFIRDIHGAHFVYSGSKYFQYDRYNFGLDTHFYTHNSMLEVMGRPKRKYGMLVESEIIVPDDYTIFKKNSGLEKDFDLIFTYSDEILQTIPNSRYVPYYIKPQYKIFSSDNYKYKSKNISIIASGKEMVPLHKYRNAIARQCKTNNLADTYGTFDGGRYCDISEPFKDYRFSIVIENEITPYGFTEKITNCFAAMTIPIYIGASKVDEIFNPDGIIQFKMTDDIEEVIKKCTKEFYEERIHAIIDNFNMVIIDKSADDIIYENYIYKDVGKLNPGELIKSLRN